MAISVNRVILVGRLGADPEKTSDKAPVKMRVATSESWKDRSGERQERTEWHQVICWNEHAGRFSMDYLKKGDLVYIEGQLETRKWEKDDGTTQYVTEVVLRPYSGVVQAQSQSREGGEGRGPSRSSDRGSERGSGNDRQSGRSYGGGRPSSDMDDEIPF